MQRVAARLAAHPQPDALRQRHREGGSPFLASAKLKLVDGCNLRCFMCAYWKRDRPDELTTEEVRQVLDDLSDLGCEKVHFTGGELFLRRDAVELVRHAAHLGMRTNLTTNGTVATKDQLRALLKVPVRSVTVSIDSPVPHIHDRIRGVPGAFTRTLRTLDRLLTKRRPKTRIRINTVVSQRNLHTMAQMALLLRDRPVDGWLPIPVDGPQADALTPEDIRHWNARIAPILADSIHIEGFDPWIFGRSEEEIRLCGGRHYARGYYRRHKCHIPWFHTLVGPNGDVYPCCTTHRRMPPLGNVRATRLRELWRGPAYQALRIRMLTDRLPHCHECDDFLVENQALEGWLDDR